jgi:hypothetical protein
LSGVRIVPSNIALAENMRRMFYKWLTAARKVRHKRVTLQERETEMRRIQLEAAWDKWRGRFQAERLLPLVGATITCGQCATTGLTVGIGEDVRPAKSECDHVSRVHDLALQNKGTVSYCFLVGTSS